jgi:hypothetical protein
LTKYWMIRITRGMEVSIRNRIHSSMIKRSKLTGGKDSKHLMKSSQALS